MTLVRSITLGLSLVVALAGCAQSTEQEVSMSQLQSSPSPSFQKPTTEEVTQLSSLAQTSLVRITTNKGVIDLELFPDLAPVHVANFLKLTQQGFYDGLTFHRVVANFVVQGGDPAGNGTGGPGYSIPAEFNDRPHLRGTLAMARSSDPDSAGSQFYLALKGLPELDGNYTVFGQMVNDTSLLDKIEVGDQIQSMTIVPRTESPASSQ